MNSVQELNKKVWYRLLKVLYLGIFSLIALVIIIFAFAIQNVPSNYIVTCNWDNQSLTLRATHLIYLSSNVSNWSLDDREAVASQCFSSASQESSQASASTTTGLSDKEIIEMGATPTEGGGEAYYEWVLKYMGIDISNDKNFQITTPIHTSAGLKDLIEFVIIGLLIEALIFEVIRRSFYYVMLGKLFNIK